MFKIISNIFVPMLYVQYYVIDKSVKIPTRFIKHQSS